MGAPGGSLGWCLNAEPTSGVPLSVLQTFAHTISHKPTTGQGIVSPLGTGVKAEARDSQILRG